MDEVRTLTRAGEQVGRALGNGIHAVRKRAEHASERSRKVTKRAARRAEKRLAKRGLTPHQLAEAASENFAEVSQEVVKRGRKARKELAKNAKKLRKEMRQRGRKARKELIDRFEPAPKRRKWPFLLLILGAVGAVAAVVLTRKSQQPELVQVDEAESTSDTDKATINGSRAKAS